MDIGKDTEVIYPIIGRRKRGKTTLGVYMMRKGPSRVMFDPRGMVKASDGSPVEGQALPHRVRKYDGLEVAMDMLAEGSLQEVVYTPNENSLVTPFQTFCSELKRWVDHPDTSARRLSVLVDELGWLEVSHRDNATLRRVLRSCEPDLFNVFLTCHRPIDVPVNTRSIADFWIMFHCVQEHDLDVIRERCGELTATRVQSLTGRSFVCFDDAEGKLTEYPDRPDAQGKNPWYIELRTVTERATVEPSNALTGLAGMQADRLTNKLPLD